MPVNLSEIHVGTAALGCPPGEARQMPGIESRNFGHKKAGTQIWSRHSSWLVARRKSKDFKVSKASRFQPEAIPHDLETLKPCHFETFNYAVLLGLTVKSLTCVKMLDICMPFSCETNGSNSATNWSFTSSLISSWRLRSPPVSKSATVTSSARASRSSDESVGVAFSFSIFDT